MGLGLLIYGFLGVLMIAVSLPLMYDKIPPNGFYGFRTPRTLSDPKIWYPANRVAGRNLTLSGLVISVTALIIFLIHKTMSPGTALVALLAVSSTATIAAVVHALLALRRM